MKLKSYLLKSILMLCALILMTACGGSDEPSEPEQAAEQGSVARGKVVNTDSATATTAPGGAPTNISSDASEANSSQDAGESGEGGEGESPNTATFNIVMNDSYYGETDDNVLSPPTWTVETGKVMLVNVDNLGKEKHNWVIMKPGAQIAVPYEEGQNSDMIFYNPGMVYAQSKTQLVVNAPDPGDYAVICTVAGHYPFMQGRLVVTVSK